MTSTEPTATQEQNMIALDAPTDAKGAIETLSAMMDDMEHHIAELGVSVPTQLEAVKAFNYFKKHRVAIRAYLAALASPAQEPVAFRVVAEPNLPWSFYRKREEAEHGAKNLLTYRKGCTSARVVAMGDLPLASPAQEPVAWRGKYKADTAWSYFAAFDAGHDPEKYEQEPLYLAAPPAPAPAQVGADLEARLTITVDQIAYDVCEHYRKIGFGKLPPTPTMSGSHIQGISGKDLQRWLFCENPKTPGVLDRFVQPTEAVRLVYGMRFYTMPPCGFCRDNNPAPGEPLGGSVGLSWDEIIAGYSDALALAEGQATEGMVVDPAVAAAHAQFGGDLADMQRRYDEGVRRDAALAWRSLAPSPAVQA